MTDRWGARRESAPRPLCLERWLSISCGSLVGQVRGLEGRVELEPTTPSFGDRRHSFRPIPQHNILAHFISGNCPARPVSSRPLVPIADKLFGKSSAIAKVHRLASLSSFHRHHESQDGVGEQEEGPLWTPPSREVGSSWCRFGLGTCDRYHLAGLGACSDQLLRWFG